MVKANESNQQILNKLTTVFGKLDAVLRQMGVAYVDRAAEDSLIDE